MTQPQNELFAESVLCKTTGKMRYRTPTCEHCGNTICPPKTQKNLKTQPPTKEQQYYTTLQWINRNIDRIHDWSDVPGGVILVVDKIQEEVTKALKYNPDK